MNTLRKQWNDTCRACGLKPISMDTAARIMAIVYMVEDEQITHSEKLRADLEYIMDEYHIKAGEKPDAWFIAAFKKYADKVEYATENRSIQQWARDLMKENYNINI